MAKETLNFTLHHLDGFLVLDGQEIYKWVDENSPAKARLARYVQKWCEYLNYPLFHNDKMGFEDAEYARMGAWLDGYAFAKNYRYDETNKAHVILETERYIIILPKPYQI